MANNTTDQMVDDYYNGGSPETVAAKYGRHVSTLWKAIREERIRNPDRTRTGGRQRGPKTMADKSTISPLHISVGLKIAKYRAVNEITVSDLGQAIDVSRVRIRTMEVGAHDFTLTELVNLSHVLKIPLEELIK
ncbi:transcriptional regulator [Caulobacter phage Seuss]|uniref:Transcriptional regulator n=1 Tax=Caulobacter phage Seuss TaxID=1675601 RepID=A0A0K1LN15_9CAUD|nr:transcriptional regulator [Caulobacter phage Seuss]AKU43603.1 transcriptional regulator [Caulobacter phage Seuss]